MSTSEEALASIIEARGKVDEGRMSITAAVAQTDATLTNLQAAGMLADYEIVHTAMEILTGCDNEAGSLSDRLGEAQTMIEQARSH